MIRQIIRINQEKCTGCGLCATACHEGAIDMVDGKAHLVREHFCDGLGDCLPACPAGAITFERREAPAYDEAAVLKAKAAAPSDCARPHAGGCPGAQAARLTQPDSAPAPSAKPVSRLGQWPVQIKLAPVQAPFFGGARLLVAADCAAYAYAAFHEDFMQGKVTLIGCPKLDGVDYAEKLADILRLNDIQSVTVVRMEVPCCGGLQSAVQRAMQASGKCIPWQVVTLSRDGRICGQT